MIVLSALRAKLSCNTYLLELLNCFHKFSILGKNLNSLVPPFCLFVLLLAIISLLCCCQHLLMSHRFLPLFSSSSLVLKFLFSKFFSLLNNCVLASIERRMPGNCIPLTYWCMVGK